MQISEAIKLTMNNGWLKHTKFVGIYQYDGNYLVDLVHFETDGDAWSRDLLSLLSDKDFWIALGKGMGWGQGFNKEIMKVCDKCGIEKCGRGYFCGNKDNRWIEAYRFHWHQFIDHLASGETPESYFKEL